MIKRVGFRMNAKLEEWYAAKASEMGIPKSALMIFALQQYATQNMTVDMLEQIKFLNESFNNGNVIDDDLKNEIIELDNKMNGFLKN